MSVIGVSLGVASGGHSEAAVAAFGLTVSTDNGIDVVNATGDLSITITAPAAYAGTHTLDRSVEYAGTLNGAYAAATAQQCVVAPASARTTDADTSGTHTVGDSYTATPGLWLYDSAEALPAISGQWYRDGVAISGATGLTYVTTAAGVLSYRETAAVPGGATRTANSNAISVVAPVTFEAPTLVATSAKGVGAAPSWTGLAAGTAHANRKILLCMGAHCSIDRAINAISVNAGAITPTLIGKSRVGLDTVWMYEFALPTGTTFDLAITFAADPFGGITVHAIRTVGANFTGRVTDTGSGATVTVNQTANAGDYSVAHVQGTSVSTTWTSAGAQTQAGQASSDGSSDRHAIAIGGAHAAGAVALGFNQNSSNRVAASILVRPA